MSPDQIDCVIAEWRGWTEIQALGRPIDGSRLFGVRPNSEGEKYPLQAVPQYHKCLNAMHEVEGDLPWHQLRPYTDELANRFTDGFVGVRYTAAQRAEALLRTIGKWQESPT